MKLSHHVPGNRLLAGLPVDDLVRLTACVTWMELASGDILQRAGEPVTHVYFPLDSLVSLLAECGERQTLEVDLVGAEGMVGMSAFLGSDLSPLRAIVLKAGGAARMELAVLHAECRRNPLLQQALNRNAGILLARVAQLAACARYHVLEARLARSLLLLRERLQADRFHVTHEIFSRTLGVRRVGVTRAATTLQQHKLISYSRGDITILDVQGLERISGGCYDIVNRIARGA
jgi:CRP-like cAMP-binding protein